MRSNNVGVKYAATAYAAVMYAATVTYGEGTGDGTCDGGAQHETCSVKHGCVRRRQDAASVKAASDAASLHLTEDCCVALMRGRRGQKETLHLMQSERASTK